MTLENINNTEQILRLGLKLQTEHTAGDEKRCSMTEHTAGDEKRCSMTEHTAGDEKRCSMQQDILTGFKKIGID